MATDRFNYTSLLFTGKSQPSLEKKRKNHSLTFNEFQSELIRAMPPDLMGTWKNDLKIDFTSDDWDRFQKCILSAKFPGYVCSSMNQLVSGQMAAEFRNFERMGTLDKTMMGSDDRFETVKRMILEKRITVVTGDIAGDKTFASLNTILRRKNMEVGAIDISNIADYLDQDAQKKVIRNIQRLPVKENSRLFLTALDTHDWDGVREKWKYYALKPHHLNGLGSLPNKEGAPKPRDIVGNLLDYRPDPGNSGPKIFLTPEDAPCAN
jgi:hypothetical protein